MLSTPELQSKPRSPESPRLLQRALESSARFQALLTLAAVYLGVGLVLRLALWWSFGRAAQVTAPMLSWILPAGLLADAVQSLYLLAPFAVFLWLVPDRGYHSRTVRAIVLAGSAFWLCTLIFIAAIEYFFFAEFDGRLNLVAVDYLMYPTEIIGDIRIEYPVAALAIVAAISAAVCIQVFRRQLTPGNCAASRWRSRTVAFAVFAALLAAAVLGPSTADFTFSANRVANELAANGIGTFFRALRTNEMDYHAYYITRDPHRNLADLATQLATGGGKFTRLNEGRLDRRFPANPAGLGKLNVVVVASESFGAEFSRLYGSQHDWTPQFDAFARQGLWFKHMYASGTRTVRGLEAIVASIPPIPSVSILRRPGNEGIANWGAVMAEHGYRTSFLYGGYGYFDNMNYFFSRNGFEVHDRNDIPGPVRFANIWGVADEDLFDMAMKYYDAMSSGPGPRRPFFSIVLTTSNHKPFTFRAGVPGVKPEGGGREAGVRYADFALGYFLREAAKHSWFDDTVFVVVADHGARVYGRADIPLKTYEIPMMFYSPRHIRPGVVEQLTTQVDIAPTVLGLLGLPYDAPFFGQDTLRTPPQDRVAFFNHNYDVALYKDGTLSILGLEKSVKDVVYDRQTDTYHPVSPRPQLNDLAIAYYQTAFELFRTHRYDLCDTAGCLEGEPDSACRHCPVVSSSLALAQPLPASAPLSRSP